MTSYKMKVLLAECCESIIGDITKILNDEDRDVLLATLHAYNGNDSAIKRKR